VCSYLDAKFPQDAPHFAYAYYAGPSAFRCFSLSTGSSSRDIRSMRSYCSMRLGLADGRDEEGLGDPIEDCVSVTTVASLAEIKAKILVSIGFGCDRYNHVSDAASLRAISELTAQGGFLGAVGMSPTSAGFCFYRDCLDHIYARQGSVP